MKRAKLPAVSERVLHVQVADYLDRALPLDAWWTTFPAGGGGKIRGRSLKRVGLKAGVPDVLIIYKGRVHWIELKTIKGELSHKQHDTFVAFSHAGCKIPYVCRNLDNVEFALDAWRIPLRARLKG